MNWVYLTQGVVSAVLWLFAYSRLYDRAVGARSPGAALGWAVLTVLAWAGSFASFVVTGHALRLVVDGGGP
jgi:hypothetical protein